VIVLVASSINSHCCCSLNDVPLFHRSQDLIQLQEVLRKCGEQQRHIARQKQRLENLKDQMEAQHARQVRLTRPSRVAPTLEVTQGQILSQSPTDATRFWWHLYGS